MDSQGLQLASSYDPKDTLYWRNDRHVFERDGQTYDRAGALALLEEALKKDARLADRLLRTIDYQEKSFVEERRHDFADLRTRYTDGLSMRDALGERKNAPQRRFTRLPAAFKQGDAPSATLAFRGLSKARNVVEAECLAAVAALPTPRSLAERTNYLVRLGYHADVAHKIARERPPGAGTEDGARSGGFHPPHGRRAVRTRVRADLGLGR